MASVDEVRAEISRLTDLLLEKGRKYTERERWVEEQHRLGRQNYSGDLYSVKKNDLMLQDLSGASKTIATILTGLSTALVADVEYYRSGPLFPGRKV